MNLHPRAHSEHDAVTTAVADAVKPTAMSTLFADVHIINVQKAKSNEDICEAEVSLYQKEPLIHASENPPT